MNEVRKSVLAFVELLKNNAEAAKLSSQTTADEKEALQEAAKLLTDPDPDRNCLANLFKIIDQHDRLLAVSPDLPPEAKARLAGLSYFVTGADVYLSNVLYAAVTIGNLALGNPVTRRELTERLKALKAERTAAALKAKRAKSEKRDEIILKHAVQMRAEHRDWSRWRIAGKIGELVAKDLGRALDRGTIDTCLRAKNFV